MLKSTRTEDGVYTAAVEMLAQLVGVRYYVDARSRDDVYMVL